MTSEQETSPSHKSSLFKSTLTLFFFLLFSYNCRPHGSDQLIKKKQNDALRPTEALFPNKRLPPHYIPPLIWKTPSFIYSGNIFPPLLNSLTLSPFTRRLVFNVFQRTSANYHWTSWDFHLAQLITLSSQVHYHILPLKKMHPDTVRLCVCVYCRCRDKCALTHVYGGVNVRVLRCAWHPLKHIPNCKWFSHNTRVNEPELSVEASSGSQVGNLLVCLSWEDGKLVSLWTTAVGLLLSCFTPLQSLQRLDEVTDGAVGVS